jgi:uncharacterized membrane protein
MHSLLEAMAGASCHGLDARSLCIAGCSLPFCARCTGLYIGVAAAVLALAAAGGLRRHALPSPAVIAALGVPWALSGGAWLLEFAGIDLVGNAGRAVLGFACGASATILLAPLWARVLWPEDAQGRCCRADKRNRQVLHRIGGHGGWILAYGGCRQRAAFRGDRAPGGSLALGATGVRALRRRC